MVHQFQLNGCNIVVDTISGAIHAVDEVAYDIISRYQTDSREAITSWILSKYADREDVTEEDIQLCLDDVEELVRQGKLFTKDTYADIAGTLKARSGDVV